MNVVLAIILLLSLSFRLFYLLQLNYHPLIELCLQSNVFDQYRFMELANVILNGNLLGVTEEGHFAPMYSYFIAGTFKLFGLYVQNVFYLQSLLGIVAVYIIYKTSELIFESRTVGLISALLLGLYGPLVFMEGSLLRGAPIAYLNLFAFYFLMKALKSNHTVYYFISGLLWGLSHATRPGILLLVLCIGLIIQFRKNLRQQSVNIAVFIFAVMVMVVPTQVRNHLTGSQAIIHKQNLSIFWIGNTYDSSGIGLWRSPLRLQLAGESEARVGKTAVIFLREVRSHPGAYAQLYARKVKMFFNGYEIPGNINYYHFQEFSPVLKLGIFNFSLIFPLATLGVILALRRRCPVGYLITTLIVLSVSVIMYHIQGRYRMPSIPFYIIFAAYGLNGLCEYMREKRIVLGLSSALFVLTVALYCQPDGYIIRKYFQAQVRPIDYVNMSVAYHLQLVRKQGTNALDEPLAVGEIITNFEKAYRSSPFKALAFRTDCLINLSVFRKMIADQEGAKKSFHKAVALGYRSRMELTQDAQQRYQKLMQRSPDYNYFQYF